MSSKSSVSSSKSSVKRHNAAGGDLSHVGNSPRKQGKRSRRVSLRANSAATQALYAEAGIRNAKAARPALTVAAAHLDDVELETAWQAAIRGDYVTAALKLNRTIKQTRMHSRKRKPRGWSPWRNAMLPRRK